MVEFVDEILSTGTLSRLEELKASLCTEGAPWRGGGSLMQELCCRGGVVWQCRRRAYPKRKVYLF